MWPRYDDVREKLYDTMEFIVSEEHLMLLRNMHVDWDDGETGAPAINCKRPYGNSDVAKDIGRILGWDMPREDLPEREYQEQMEALERRAAVIHAETAIALQVALSTGAFKAGEYRRRKKYSATSWELVKK